MPLNSASDVGLAHAIRTVENNSIAVQTRRMSTFLEYTDRLLPDLPALSLLLRRFVTREQIRDNRYTEYQGSAEHYDSDGNIARRTRYNFMEFSRMKVTPSPPP